MGLSGRWQRVTLLATGILIGAAVVGTPVGAHIGSSVSHLWSQHIRPKADVRYVNEEEALWAVVNSDGTLARGSGVSSVEHTGAQYRVYFTRHVNGCAFTATIGRAGSTGTPTPGFLTVVGTGVPGPDGEALTKGVLVRTYQSSGAVGTIGFHLDVDCQRIAMPA
jgi:hypothetical protein